MKIGYNRVFGYFIEITKSNLANLEEGKYERKQTLANAERFITPELKELERLILEAEEKSVELEYQLFLAVREQVKTNIDRLQTLAKTISAVDVLQSFATISERYQYVRPTLRSNTKIWRLSKDDTQSWKSFRASRIHSKQYPHEPRNRYSLDYWTKHVREKYLHASIGFDGGHGANWLFCTSGKC